MIPNIGLALLESVHGRKLQYFLSDVTGISAKTWANGGPKKENKRNLIASRVKKYSFENFLKAGYSKDEANAILNEAVTRKNGVHGVYSDIVDLGSGFGVSPYPKTMLIANRLDRACDMWSSIPQLDISGYVKVLLSNEHLNNGWNEWQLEPQISEARLALLSGHFEIKHINNLLIYISWREFMSLLACWDVEFCRVYFGSAKKRMMPLPLFEYLMPRVRDADQWIGKQSGVPRDWHSLPFRRLLDFLSAVMWFHQHGKWPEKIPNRTSQDRYFNSEGNPIDIAKIRNGRGKLNIKQFSFLFRNGLWNTGKFEISELDVLPPFPLFFAATIWDRFFVQLKDERVTTLFYENESCYRKLWQYHYDQSEKPGPDDRIEPWPECITQSFSLSDLPDCISSQSLGLSS